MNKRHAILTGLVLAALPAVAAAAQTQTVRLRTDVRVSGDQVRLADVASVDGLPRAARTAIVATLTDERPTVRVDINALEQVLRRNGINPVPVRFSGAAQCIVRRKKVPTIVAAPKPASSPVATGIIAVAAATAAPVIAAKPLAPKPDATIGDRIRRQLVGQLGAAAEDITLGFSPSSQATIALAVTDQMSIFSTDRRQLGRRRWQVAYTVDGRPYRKYVAATVSVRRKVVKATRALTVGETVAAGDVRLVDHVDDGRGELMGETALVVGQQVRRAIKAGSVVSPQHLTSPVLIKRGQEVWVQCGPVLLPVRALANGRRGEWVVLENVQSKGRFSAIVTGPGQAEVMLIAAKPIREAGR